MNKLASEKSPYLLQHADNPVDWFPWGDEAFEKARKQDKAIFLSIGYSTCHWCHVMAHESFEDPEVAELINDVFVPIKVDREERPDIDKIYMTVCQVLTGSGGWPLSIFMTPEKEPFFAGTYFPKQSRFGRIGLVDLIKKIKNLWENERSELLKGTQQIINAVQNATDEKPGEKLGKEDLKTAYNQLSMRFDEKFGGFGTAPKFPSPHNLLFLLRIWKRTKNEHALEMVEKTLNEMRKGGIFDQIGFGFHRYSTDQTWLVPHFEKMLYDQALLALAYLEAYQITNRELFAHTAREIFSYILRDMTSPEGGFYSAEDADSEGVEGKFYVWKKEEIYQLLDVQDAKLIEKIYNLTEQGNFLEEATKEKTGTNILHMKKLISEIGKEIELNQYEIKMKLEQIRQKLFEYREQRIHPSKDDKILTDWNGLMIAAFAKGSRVLGEKKYLNTAEKAFEFIISSMIDKDGRLLHRYREEEAEINAFIDDYAFLIWGILELYEATFEAKYVKHALRLNNELIEHFWDDYLGGFYFSADDSEDLIVRQKEIYDGAIPSGNSVAMYNLLRLSYITGNTDLEEKAELISRIFSDKIKDNPVAFTQLMSAVDYAVGPTYSLVISGDLSSPDTKKMVDTLNSNYLPHVSAIFKPSDEEKAKINEYADYIQYFNKVNDRATAYVCVDKTCKKPTNEIEVMLDFLDSNWD
jgi:hypothetical protein